MSMKRTENTQKNIELEQQKTLLPATRYIAGTGSKSETRRTVRPFEGIGEERREQIYISRALSGVPRGTSVLNWPCGCGRLLPFLKKLGYHVTLADSSSVN